LTLNALSVRMTLKLFFTCFGHAILLGQLWKDVSGFISSNILPNFSMNPKTVIFEADSNACFVINLIIFLCSLYIHKCKVSNCKPFFLVFLHEIKHYLTTIPSSLNPKALRTCNICKTNFLIYLIFRFIFI